MKAAPPLILVLLGASLALAQQEETPQGPGTPVTETPPIIIVPAQPAGPTEEGEGPGGAEANEPPNAGQMNGGREGRSQFQGFGRQGGGRRSEGRQPRQNRPGRDRGRSRLSRQSMGAETEPGANSGTNSANSLDFAAFRVIAELNIFDPNRVPSGPPPVKAPVAEYFRLVGTSRHGTGTYPGTYAYFSGSASKYERKLKVSDSIAGYKVKTISFDSVKLADATNELVMQMGMQMRKEENGPWRLSGEPITETGSSSSSSSSSLASSLTSSSSSSGTNSAAAVGPESDILKRMMQRREKE
jgi:hypothetical protein